MPAQSKRLDELYLSMATTYKLAALAAALVIILLQASTRAVVARPGGGASSMKIDGMPVMMTVNGFERGESSGEPVEWDEQYHSDGELVVALSSQWDGNGRRCQRSIRITSAHIRCAVEARVVDEYDSKRRHCRDNDVDTSRAVWKALGLDTNVSEVPVTWSDA